VSPAAGSRRARVLVVDDSAFARKVVRQVLEAEADLEVVAIARDGLDALEKIAELAPDVVTLDLHMPGLDGLGVLRALAAGPAAPRPQVVVVSTTDADADLAIEALAAGAVEFVHKPTSLATERLYDLGHDLVAKVRIAAGARVSPAPAPAPAVVPAVTVTPEILVIGASTGGPQALTRLFSGLPASFPVPVALVLHMPVGYTAAFAARLDGLSPLHVVEATEGLEIRPGTVVVARAGTHLRLGRDPGDARRVRAHLDFAPVDTLHRPAVDVLFASAAAAYGAKTLGLVLTGMGEDGLAGARAIAAAGGRLFTEDESSCVVYGRPRAVAEAGLSSGSLPVDQIPEVLVKLFGT